MSGNKFTPEEIERLRGLASKATPRPWGFYDAFEPVNKPGFVNFVRMGTNDATVIEGDLTIRRADAEWLHESTHLLPAALNEIERLRAELDALQSENEFHRRNMSELAKSLFAERTTRTIRSDEMATLQAHIYNLENGRPMECAPKDGTEIMAEVTDKYNRHFDFVEWDGEKWIGNVSDYTDVYEEVEYRSDYLSRWWPLPGGAK